METEADAKMMALGVRGKQSTKIKTVLGIFITDNEILMNCNITIVIHLRTAALSSVRPRATIFPPESDF